MRNLEKSLDATENHGVGGSIPPLGTTPISWRLRRTTCGFSKRTLPARARRYCEHFNFDFPAARACRTVSRIPLEALMNVRIASLILVFLVGLLAAPNTASAQWVGVDAHTTGTGPVVRAGDREAAKAQAIAACRRRSNACSGMPALANLGVSPNIIFAYMCCTQPHLGCAIGAATTKTEAAAAALKIGTSGGLAACTVRKYLSAKTGKNM
jgi:hypothetical protein